MEPGLPGEKWSPTDPGVTTKMGYLEGELPLISWSTHCYWQLNELTAYSICSVNVSWYYWYRHTSLYWASNVVFFTNWRQHSLTSKKMMSCFIALLALLGWTGTEPAVWLRSACSTHIYSCSGSLCPRSALPSSIRPKDWRGYNQVWEQHPKSFILPSCASLCIWCLRQLGLHPTHAL